MQLLLDHPECRIHGSIRSSSTPGYVEALPGEQEFNAYSITLSLLYKDDTRLTDVIVWRVEVSSRSAIHPIRCGASVMCLPSMSKRIGIPSPCYGGRDSERKRVGAPRCCKATARHTLSVPSRDNALSEEQDLYQSWLSHYNHMAAVWQYM